MHKRILEVLSCPICKGNLHIIIEEGSNEFIKLGSLVCENSDSNISIVDDIPRLTLNYNKTRQNSTYSYWWNVSHENIIYNEFEIEKLFSQTIKINKEKFRGRKVIDIGCGNGRFSSIISKYDADLLVLVDISDGIDKAYKDATKNNKNVVAIQCDILKMPLREKYFDVAYSWGVLHHTGNTKLAFEKASSIVCDNGNLGVYLYENKPNYKYDNTLLRLASIFRQLIVISPLRYLSQFLSPSNVIRFFTPIFYFERTINFGIIGCHSNGKDRNDKFRKGEYMRRVIDRFKSRYASEHNLEEIVSWFIKENFDDLRIGEGVKVCISGTKNELPREETKITLYR